MRALQITRPDTRRQAIPRRIRKRDRLRFIIERRDRHDRSENLLLQNATIAIESGDDCRLDEVAFAFDASAAGRDRAAFFFREVDVAYDFVEMCGADQRTDLRLIVERIADRQRSGPLDEVIHEVIVDLAFNEDPRSAQADLALIPERRTNRFGTGSIEVGIRKDDGRILPA